MRGGLSLAMLSPFDVEIVLAHRDVILEEATELFKRRTLGLRSYRELGDTRPKQTADL